MRQRNDHVPLHVRANGDSPFRWRRHKCGGHTAQGDQSTDIAALLRGSLRRWAASLAWLVLTQGRGLKYKSALAVV